MSSEHHDIDYLILKILSGKASGDDSKRFQEWLNESEDHKAQFEMLKLIWREKSREPDIINSEEVLDNIWLKGIVHEQQVIPKRSFNIGFYLKIAAVITVFIVSSFFIIQYVENEEKASQTAKDENIKITKVNPAGQKSKIILPDGSKAWLNSLSSITYKKNFSTNRRQIDLIGEAYFEVKEDSTKPFVVNSGSLKTTALGTSFNVSAYPEDEVISVALLTGKVIVSNNNSALDEVILDPNNGVSYYKDSDTISRNIISDEVIAWKDGMLIFNGENFYQFKRKIEKWYDVEVNISGQIPTDWNIRASFDNEYLSNIMNTISFNKKFTYQLEDNKLFINFK